MEDVFAVGSNLHVHVEDVLYLGGGGGGKGGGGGGGGGGGEWGGSAGWAGT